MGSTLNSLSSQGRFGTGSGHGGGFALEGHERRLSPTFEREAEFIQLMRKLWRGERELNSPGILGSYPTLQLAHYVNEDIPVLYVGFGSNSLHQAGKPRWRPPAYLYE